MEAIATAEKMNLNFELIRRGLEEDSLEILAILFIDCKTM